MEITESVLRSYGSCKPAIDVFKREWPDGCDVTTEVIARAYALGLNVDYLARHMLPAAALAEYQEVTAPAWAEYEKVTTAAWAEYEKVVAPAWAGVYDLYVRQHKYA